jgi:hypothetical protein
LPTVFITSRSRVDSSILSPARDVARPLDHLALELLDFDSRHFAEILVERLAGLRAERCRSDCVRPRHAVAEFRRNSGTGQGGHSRVVSVPSSLTRSKPEMYL